MKPNRRTPRAARFLEPSVRTIPKSPGSNMAKKILLPRSKGRCNCAAAAVVVTVSVVVVWPGGVMLAGLRLHVDSEAGSEQVNVIAEVKPAAGTMVMVEVPDCPWVAEASGPERVNAAATTTGATGEVEKP